MTAKTTDSPVSKPVAWVAALAGVILIVGACSGSAQGDPAAVTSAPPIEVATTLVAVPVDDALGGVDPSGSGTVAVVDTTVPLITPGDALLAALSTLGTSYTFASDITTSSGDSVVVAGSRVGDGLQYRVEAGGAVIDVITVNGQTWILEDGSTEWIDAGPVAGGDPLGPLAQPVDISYEPSTNSTLRATYAGAALGLDVNELIDVLIAYDGTSMSFTSTNDDLRLTTTLLRADVLAQILPPAL